MVMSKILNLYFFYQSKFLQKTAEGFVVRRSKTKLSSVWLVRSKKIGRLEFHPCR